MGTAAPDQAGPDRVTAGRAASGKRRTLKRVAGAVFAVGLIVLGAGLGQLLWPARVTIQEVVSPPDPGATDAGVALSLPSVEGLDERTARAAIADAGFGASTIVNSAVPAAGPAGFVVAQGPDAGSAEASEIKLVISEAVTMPSLTGQPLEDAQRAIDGLFGVTQIERVTTADAPAGTVVSTVPAAGEPMTVDVTVRVADGGSSLSVLDLESVERSGCSAAKDVPVNGSVQTRALSCQVATGRTGHVEYAIGRHAVYFESTAGLDDRRDQGTATLRVIGDGKTLATVPLSFGTTQNVRVEVRDVLRLRLEVTARTGERPAIVLGQPRLVGNPNELDVLGG